MTLKLIPYNLPSHTIDYLDYIILQLEIQSKLVKRIMVKNSNKKIEHQTPLVTTELYTKLIRR